MTPMKTFQEAMDQNQRLGDTLSGTTPGRRQKHQQGIKGKLFSREDIDANIAQIKATVPLDKVNKALAASQKQMQQ